MFVETFAHAKKRLLDELQARGWKLSHRDLKVPWADDPESGGRLWFKAQAVYFSMANNKGSLVSDMRGQDSAELVRLLRDEVIREVMDR